MARNLPIPLGQIRDLIKKMFWAPEELAGDVQARVRELQIANPGVLTYLPSDLMIPDVPQEEEELNEIPRAVEIETPEESINIMRTNIAQRASALMDDFGHDFIPVNPGQFRQGPSTVLVLPVREMSFTDLLDAYRTATKVTRNKTKHDEVWVVHFPKALPATENLPGLNQPAKAGAHILVYKASVHGHRRAEVLAKRHLAKQGGEEAASSSSTTAAAGSDQQPAAAAAAGSEEVPAPDTEGHPRVILVDVFGGMSASRVALIASRMEVMAHHYIEIHDPAIHLAQS